MKRPLGENLLIIIPLKSALRGRTGTLILRTWKQETLVRGNRNWAFSPKFPWQEGYVNTLVE